MKFEEQLEKVTSLAESGIGEYYTGTSEATELYELVDKFKKDCLSKQKVKRVHDRFRTLFKDKAILAEIDAMDKELGL